MNKEEWLVGEYAREIHDYLRLRERKRFLYRGHSPQLHYRTMMVEFLNGVCDKMGFCTLVHHLAVYLLDIFMDNHTIHCDHLKIVAVGSLIVAVKLEEKDSLIPKNSEFNSILGNKYKLIEFVQMEVSILNFFNWDILFPTTAHFAEYYTLYAVHPTDQIDNKPMSNYKIVVVYIQKYIDYFLEISVHEQSFVNESPSLLAAACISSARSCIVLTPPWPILLQDITYYKFAQLKSIMDAMLKILDRDIAVQHNKKSASCSESAVSKESEPMKTDSTDCIVAS